MSELRRHNRLEDFVRLLMLHEEEIKKSMRCPHPINKIKNFKDRHIISTGELCIVFVNSSNPLAQRFGYGFGMESATVAQFQEMIHRVHNAGFQQEAGELQRRMDRCYIDIQFSGHLLNADSRRTLGNSWNYKDYSFFQNYQCLTGSARGFGIDWGKVKEALFHLDAQ